MKELIIIGARGLGRKTFDIAISMKNYGTEFKIKGYLDDFGEALSPFSGYPEIISTVEDYVIQPNDMFICALGDVFYREKYVNIIHGKGGKFFNVIHPNSFLCTGVRMGEGNIIFNGVTISNDCKISDYNVIQPNSVLGHDTSVGSYCQINSFSFTGGYAEIKNFVTLHTRSTILPKLVVFDKAVVGAGAVVTKNVEANQVVAGVPAKLLKKLQ